MTAIVTGAELSKEVMEVLHRWGVPKHVISLTLRISAREPVEIDCTFHPTMPNGDLTFDREALVQQTKRYRLVEREPGEE